MRNPVACVSCRSAKQKCIHDDRPPCDRCKQSGRSEQCHFPAPGTSAEHRRPKRPRLAENGEGEASPAHRSSQPAATHAAAANQFRRNDALPNGFSPTHAAGHAVGQAAAQVLSPNAASSPSALLETIDPFDLITDEVKNSYLRCAYKWSFHHTPTLLRRIRDRTLEPWMAWAMLALAIR